MNALRYSVLQYLKVAHEVQRDLPTEPTVPTSKRMYTRVISSPQPSYTVLTPLIRPTHPPHYPLMPPAYTPRNPVLHPSYPHHYPLISYHTPLMLP